MTTAIIKITGAKDDVRSPDFMRTGKMRIMPEFTVTPKIGTKILDATFALLYMTDAERVDALAKIIDDARKKLHADSSFTVYVEVTGRDFILSVYQDAEQAKREPALAEAAKNAPFEYWMQ